MGEKRRGCPAAAPYDKRWRRRARREWRALLLKIQRAAAVRELRAGGAGVGARHAVISGGAGRHVVIIGRCPSHRVNEETAGKRVMARAGAGADDNGAVSGTSDSGVLQV